MNVEYKARITGDMSGLEKVLKAANGSMKQLTDKDFIIKLDYDGNVKALNKTLSDAVKACPELAIQFQYDVNKKALDQKLNEIKELETLKADIDTGKVQRKVREMVSEIKTDFDSQLISDDDLKKKIQDLYKYANSAAKAGVDVTTSFEGFEEIDQTLGGFISKLSKTPQYLGDMSKGVDGALQNAQKDLAEIQKQLDYFKSKGAVDMTEGFDETEQEIDETSKKLKELVDGFEAYYKKKKGLNAGNYWKQLKQQIDDGDESLKELLSDLKLLDDGTANLITAGSKNEGGLIGEERVAIARKNDNNQYEDTLALKKALDEAYDAGANVARILDVIGDESRETFVEIQERATGKMLAAYGQHTASGLPEVNPDFLEATDEQIQKLIKDIFTLQKLGINAEAHPENLIYDKLKGFQFIDLDLNPTSYVNSAEMIEDAAIRIAGDVEDMYDELDDPKGLKAIQNFGDRFRAIGTAMAEVVDTAEKATEEAQDSHSPSKVAEKLGAKWGIGYAEGIKKHKGDVEDAVRELVKAGDLTMQDLVEDLPNIVGNAEYSDLENPVKKILADAEMHVGDASEEAAGKVDKAEDSINAEGKAAKTTAKEKEKLAAAEREVATASDEATEAIKKENAARKEGVASTSGHGYLRKENRDDNGLKSYVEKVNDFINKRVTPVKDANGKISYDTKYLFDYDKALSSISDLDEKILRQIHDIKNATEEEAAPMLTNLHLLEAQRKEAEDWVKAMVASPKSEANQSQLDELEKVRTAKREQLQVELRIHDAQAETARAAKEQAKADKEAAVNAKMLHAAYAENEDRNIAARKKERAIQAEITDAWKSARRENKEFDEDRRIESLRQVEKIYSDILDIEKKIIEAETKGGDRSKELSVLQESLKVKNIELFKASQVAKSLDEQFSLEKKKAEIRSKNVKLAQAEDAAARKVAEAEEAARKAAEKKAHDTRAKEYENIFYNGAGKLKDVEFAPNAEALRNSNALYDELEATAKRVYDLKEASLKLDAKTLAGSNAIAENEAEIAELSKKARDIYQEINEAEAVQETRENALLEIDREREGVLSKILLNQELQSRDEMSGQVGKWITQVENLQKSGKYAQEFREQLDKAYDSLIAFNAAEGSIEEVNAAFEKLDQTMKDINSNKGLSEFKKAQESSIAKLNLQIEEFAQKNSKMGADFQRRFANLKLNWDTEHTLEEVQQLVAEFSKLKAEVTAAGKTGASFFDTLRQRAMGVNAQLIAQYLSWQDLLRYARQAIEVVNDLDYALVDLKKTTTMNAAELKDFYYASNDVAKQTGVTTEEIINQAAAWSRLGYSSKEAATEMAALSSQFAQISPGMDVETATDGLVSTMKAFHVDVANVEKEVMDVINKTGNTMATTNEEIVEMLKRSSAAMSAANNSIKETIALESAAVQITRNAETTGTAFRTISMRIRGYDEETEEYIGGIEELTGKVADLTKTASSPGGISLFTDETKTTYKSTYQILKDISEIYNDLSDANQAALLETLAGKRGGQVLAGILSDFSEVERAMGEIEKSAGSADAEMSIVEESIDYKLNKLQQTWVGIIQELIDNGMLGQAIDALTRISEVLGEIITTIGPIPSLLAGLGVRELLLNLDKIPSAINSIEASLKAGGFLSTLFGIGEVSGGFKSPLEDVGKIFSDVTQDVAEVSDVFDSKSLENIGQIFKDADAVSDTVEAISEMTEGTQETVETLSKLEGVFGEVSEAAGETAEAVETIGKTASGAGVSGATKLAGAFKALVPILTNPITIMLGLAAATYALYKYVDGANDRQREKIKALQKEFNALEGDLDSTNTELSNVEKQIESIQSKGTISLVEQQELERLRTQAELLKIARQEQEELLKLKAQELTGENQKHFNKVYGSLVEDNEKGKITNPEDRIQGYDVTVSNWIDSTTGKPKALFSYGEQLSSALASASKGEYNDDPTQLLAIYQQVQEAIEGALEVREKYGSRTNSLNEEEREAYEAALEVLSDTSDYMSGLEIQIGKVKTELLDMKSNAERAGTEDSKALAAEVNEVLKLVYQYSETSKEWNAMQISSIFDNDELELSRKELEAMASAGELSESTLKQYPKLRDEISKLDLILEQGETAFGLFKNELLASAEAAKETATGVAEALDAAKQWDLERFKALEKLGLAKEVNGEVEYDESWTKYLETIKALNPEIADNAMEVEKCALANLQFSKAVDDLSKNFKTYKEALKDADALTPEFSDAINALADDLTYLTGINFSISEAADFLGAANNLELLEKAINGSDEALQQLQAHAEESIKIKIDDSALKEMYDATQKALLDIPNELAKLGEGGTVDLNMRPVIDTQLLRDVGWVIDAADEYATVFTKTFSNETGDIAVNFTPILVDENGNYKDVLSEESLDNYVSEYFSTGADPWNLKIGAEFTGQHAVEEAIQAAQRIHELHEIQIELGIDSTQFNEQLTGLVDWLNTADLGTLEAQTYLNEDPFIQALVDLAQQSATMADKIRKIFSDLGWNIDWDYQKMRVPKMSSTGSHYTSTYAKDANGNPIAVGGQGTAGYVKWDWDYLDVPTNIHFERKSGNVSRKTPTSGYTPKSTSPSQKSNAASNIDKANGGGGGGSEKEDDYKESFDYFERLIKILDKQIDLLEAHLHDVVGSFAKNTLLDAEENLVKQKMAGYSSAIEMYSAKASEALSKIPSDIAAKVVNGAVAIDDFVGESNKDVYEAIQEYEQWADKVWDCKQQIVELREALRQLELQKFKNVAQDFQELFDVRKTQIDLISKAIDLFSTARDKIVGRAFYDESIEQTEKQLNSLLEKRTALTNQMTSAIANGIEVANEEWFEMLDAVEQVNADILDAQKSIEDYKNAIIQLYVDAFDREANRYSKQIALRQKAIDALERQISVVASAGNVAGREYYDQQIEQTAKQIVMLEEERRELERRLSAAIDNGVREGTDEWYSMVDAINEVDAAIQSANQSIEEYKNSIVELYMELFNREADRYSKQVELRQKAIDALANQIALVESAGNVAGEAYFEEQIKQTQEQIVMLEAERRELEKRMQEGIANGVKVGTDEWYEMVNAINEVDSAIQSAKQSVEDYKNSIIQLYVELFERESARYTNQISLRQKAVAALEKQIDAVEAAGNVVGESYIKEQIEQTQKQMAMLQKERDELVRKMSNATANGVKVGTDEWYSMVDSLNEVDTAIQECVASIEAMDDAILALHTETFDRIQQRFSSLSSEISNMADMFEDFDVATENNTWTKEGLSQLGLYAQQYEMAKKQVAQYNAEIEELNKQYATGKYSVTQYTTKLAELKDAQWNSIKAAQQAKDSIVSLNKARVDIVVEGINKEIKAFQELTDAQREQLSAEKDLHDYEKSIAESAKSITDLERQLAAMADDDSAAARAKRLKLEEELQEAREELAEKEYDHSIEMQQEALAQQAEDYEEARELEIEALQATLEEEQSLLVESFNAVKENAALIEEELLLMAQNLNITMSPEIVAPWQAGEAAIASYSELLTIESSAFIETLAAVEASEWSLQEQANSTSQSISDMFGNSADNLVAQTNTANDTFREEEQAAINASTAIAENFSKQSNELVAQTNIANETFRAEEEAALRASAAIAENFSNRADSLVATTNDAYAAFREEEAAAEDASRAIADAFGNRADELVATIENARNSTENLSRMSDALADSLSNSIDGSYSGGSAVSALDSIADAANGVAEAARNAAREIENLGLVKQQSTRDVTIYGGYDGTGKYVGTTTAKVTTTTTSNGTSTSVSIPSRSSRLRQYASGIKRVSSDELAWTQEDGLEMIVSPTDGAVLTPLKSGQSVLPADQTANIWEWSKFDPTEFARKLIQSTPNTGGTVQANTMQVGSLVTVNGNINDSMEMMKIASTTASNKIKQSFYELSNGLNR